jgi:hypothetical protein
MGRTPPEDLAMRRIPSTVDAGESSKMSTESSEQTVVDSRDESQYLTGWRLHVLTVGHVLWYQTL